MSHSDHSKFFGAGIGTGTLVAFALSWFEHQSFVWAVVHAIYSWFYVAYYVLTKNGMMAPIENSPALTALAVVLAVIMALVAFVGVVSRSKR